MSVCTFFGHRDCPESVRPIVRAVLEILIEEQGVDLFYVGNQGRFDAIVHGTLQQLQQKYPHIQYAVVLAYMPGRKKEYEDHFDTMLPEGIEAVHPHYALTWRNRWMLKQADFVVTHITHHWGGAARFAESARKQKKTVINIDAQTFDALPPSVLERLLMNDAQEVACLSAEDCVAVFNCFCSQNPPAETTDAQASWEQFRTRNPEFFE